MANEFIARKGLKILEISEETTTSGSIPFVGEDGTVKKISTTNFFNENNSQILNTTLSGFTATTDTVILSTDNVLQAFEKTQAQLNAKQNNLILTTTGSSGASTLVGDTLNIPNYTLSGLGGVPTSRTLTINGTSFDLSADRSWTISAGIAGTIASGQVAFGSGTNTVAGSSTFTFSPTAQLLLNNSVTASSAIARGANLTPSLTASANNDVLVGLDINPTFTNGAFTGVGNLSIRTNTANAQFGAIGASTGQFRIDGVNGSAYAFSVYSSNTLRFGVTGFGGVTTNNSGLDGGTGIGIFGTLRLNDVGATLSVRSGGSGFNVAQFKSNNGVTKLLIPDTGNVLINTTTDSGFQLDVNGTARVQGAVRVNTSAAFEGITVVNSLASGTSAGRVSVQADSTDFSFFNHYNTTSTDGFANNGGFGSTKSIILFTDATVLSGGTGSIQFRVGGYQANQERLRINPTGNVLINTTTDAGFRLDVNGTARVQGQLTVTGSTTASGAIARGANYTPTLVAAANNDVLVGLDVNPTFTNGAFTGVQNLAARFNLDSNNGLKIHSASPLAGAPYTAISGNLVSLPSNTNYGFYVQNSGNNAGINGAQGVQLQLAGTTRLALLFNTGNVLIQNGGTFTDAGFRLDVNGTARVQGNTTFGTIGTGTGMFWDNANNRLGIGISTPLNKLHVFSSTVADGISVDGTSFPAIVLRTNGTIRGYAPFIATGTGFFNDAVLGDMGFRSENNRVLFGVGSNNSTMQVSNGYVGINIIAAPPSASAILEVSSTTRGFLPPRMTSAQRDAIVTPAAGLEVFNTTTNTPSIFNGTNWQNAIVPNSTGNVLINTTTDAGFRLDVNGTARVQGSVTFGTLGSGTGMLWDNTNNRLGIGVTPLAPLHIESTRATAVFYSNGLTTPISFTDTNALGAWASTKMVGVINQLFGASGGLGFQGFTSSDNFAFSLTGHVGSTTPTASAVVIQGWKSNGTTGRTAMTGNELIAGFQAGNTTTVLSVAANGNVNYFDGGNFVLGTTTGTKIGTATSQKLSFWNVNPIVQPANSVAINDVLANIGLRASGGISNFTTDIYIGSSTINSSAILQADSTTKGFLPPRMTSAERDAIVSPVTGLTVYDSTSNEMDVYDGTSWRSLQYAITNPVTGTGILGQVAFWNSTSGLTGDNSFTWDNTIKRLGINNNTPSHTLDVSGTTRVQSDLFINNSIISNQQNLDVDSGSTRVIATVSASTYTAVFFDFSIKNGTNLRCGTIYATHDGTNVIFIETSTADLGNTTPVELSVDLSGGNIRLLATTTTDNWVIKTLIRGI